jgi:hypothetical protein
MFSVSTQNTYLAINGKWKFLLVTVNMVLPPVFVKMNNPAEISLLN